MAWVDRADTYALWTDKSQACSTPHECTVILSSGHPGLNVFVEGRGFVSLCRRSSLILGQCHIPSERAARSVAICAKASALGAPEVLGEKLAVVIRVTREFVVFAIEYHFGVGLLAEHCDL